MIPETVDTEVLIGAAHSHRTWHAQLPNGKDVIAFVEDGLPDIVLEPGARVPARLTVADFSRALILVDQISR